VSTILLGVTGSIAAYKSADLVRQLIKSGHQVHVIMTPSATHFIGELTLKTLSRNPVAVDMFDEDVEWVPEHISLADKADIMIVAPCTANVIAKLANGISDDLLTCTALACDVPMLIAPAMNVKMWNHPATVENVSVLAKRNVTIVDAEDGDLACGYAGKGRMAEPATIVEIAESMLSK
jgi:phosphopantothenoylcysteine decarboxylase/phosphopantothenate--cysteine ligase